VGKVGQTARRRERAIGWRVGVTLGGPARSAPGDRALTGRRRGKGNSAKDPNPVCGEEEASKQRPKVGGRRPVNGCGEFSFLFDGLGTIIDRAARLESRFQMEKGANRDDPVDDRGRGLSGGAGVRASSSERESGASLIRRSADR